MRRCEILLVEDNPGDVLLLTEAFREVKLDVQVRVATDGEEALNVLWRRPPHEHAHRPDLILLDWNLPRRSGWEVLAEIKNDADLCEIPVIVLTNSSDSRDIRHAYKSHANCYLTKPVDVNSFFDLVRSFEHFWFRLAKLPSLGASARMS
jgi:two-component system, chemotaxis family, response regulator Rcp1